MQIDPQNIVLYRSVYTGERIDTLLSLVSPTKELADDLRARVRTIEDKLSPKVMLTIQQMDFTGGTNIQSPAGGEIIAVEDLPRGYKCYFDTNHGSEPVLFHVNDQAMGRRYDIGTTTGNYFWRLVTEVGEDYIVLSKTDCDPTSGAPAVGDKVITVGNRYDIARQNIKLSSTIGENRDEWYTGISSYSLENKLVTVVGVFNGQVGIWTKNGSFSGEIHITGGQGLDNLEEWEEAAQQISDAWDKALEAETDSANAKYTADAAALKAERIQLQLERINSDTVLDIAEKKSLRTEWITINGLEDLDRSGGRGSYYLTKRLLEQYSNLGKQTTFVYNGVEFSFGGVEYTFALSGTSALDAAYLALREYLREVGLNDRTTVFEGFDRQHLAELLTSYYDAEQMVNDSVTQAVKDGLETVREEILVELAGFQEAMEQQLDEMQDVIDNTIETHFAGGTPTLSNYPANQWTTEELKQRHLGDLYYDNASKESSATSGFAFRFERSGSAGSYIYSWHQLSDNAIAEALAKAAQAQDTADGKRRTFLSQPTTADAYDRGDMWLHATIGDYTNETLVCLTSKAAGAAFQAAHWGLASKYTDDTVANLARQEAGAAQTAANNAAAAASAAQTAADNAATAAAVANTRLNGWASDGSISPVEKEALRQQKKDIVAERADIVAQATAYNVSTTAYMAAYNAALTALNKYTAASPENITIGSDYADIDAYYTARSTILQAIATAAKKVATDAQAAADAAQHAADVADGKADAAQAAAAAAAAAIANINDDTILDPSEKGEIRTTWISINGVLDTDKHGQTGTYAAAKEAIDKAAGASFPVQFTYAGIIYTFAGVEYTFQNLGAASLDAAYLALREYLSGLQINTMEAFLGFDRSMYSQLLRDYNVALNNVLKTLSDIANDKADDALSSIDIINAALEKMGSDNYISAQEKLTLKTALQDESVVHNTLQTQAARYSTTAVQTALSAYNTAYTHFGNVVTYYCENFPWANDVAISADYPLSRISAYYTAREALVDAIHAAEKEAIDSKANTADFKYLKDALPANAMTEIAGGLLLANILGVKNSAGSVVAAMNGLATIPGFNDATHGVLLIAAGISSLSTAKDNAATRIFADGTIITNKLIATGGEVQRLKVQRLQNPFRTITEDSFTPIADDNVISNTLGGGFRYLYQLDWTTISSGRRMAIIGAFTSNAPDGKYFYENGQKFTAFESSYECTELLGYGNEDTFYGWIVVSRTLFSTNYNFGRNISPLAFGRVTGLSSTPYFDIIKYSKRSTDSSNIVSNGSVMAVTRNGTAVGKYYIYIPKAWVVSEKYIYVDLVGIGTSEGAGNSPIKATLIDITSASYASGYAAWRIEVWTSDDETLNNGNFFFRLYNMAQWDD